MMVVILLAACLASVGFIVSAAPSWKQIGATQRLTRHGEAGFWPSSDGRYVIFAEGASGDAACDRFRRGESTDAGACTRQFKRNVAYDMRSGTRREFPPDGHPLWLDFILHWQLLANGTLVTGFPNPILLDLASGAQRPLPWNDSFHPDVRWGDQVYGLWGRGVAVADLAGNATPQPIAWNLTGKAPLLVAANPTTVIVQYSPINETTRRFTNLAVNYEALDLQSGTSYALRILPGEVPRVCPRPDCHLARTKDLVLVAFARKDAPPGLRAFHTPTMEPAWNVTFPAGTGWVQRVTASEKQWVAEVVLGEHQIAFAHGPIDGSSLRFVAPTGEGYSSAIAAGSRIVVRLHDDGSILLARPGTVPWTIPAAAAVAIGTLGAGMGLVAWSVVPRRHASLCPSCYVSVGDAPWCPSCGAATSRR